MLCRTNIGTVTEVMRLLTAGHRVVLPRGGQTLTGLALAAQDLKEGRRTSHPELALFSSWGELQDYANYDPAGRDLQPFVELLDTHGPQPIIAAVGALTDEHSADVTVSTAHKAKGREWPQVRIADDFPQPPDTDRNDDCGRPNPAPVNETDARLAYVAVTAPVADSISGASRGSKTVRPLRSSYQRTARETTSAIAGTASVTASPTSELPAPHLRPAPPCRRHRRCKTSSPRQCSGEEGVKPRQR